MTKVNRFFAAAQAMVENYSSINQAIPTWSFDDCGWIKAEEDPEMKSLASHVEQFSIQCLNLTSTSQRLAAGGSDWMSKELYGRVSGLASRLQDESGPILTQAKELLANSMLVRKIVTKPNVEEAGWPQLCGKSLKYIRTTLQAEELVHPALLAKVLPAQATSPGAKPSKAISAAAASSHSGVQERDLVDQNAADSAAASAEPSDAAAPPPKKFCRLGGTRASGKQ